MNRKIRNLSVVSLSVVGLFTLTSCDTDKISERIETVVNNMLPNLWVTLMQLLLFVAVAVAFIFLAYKPIKKKLQARADHIEANIKDSEIKQKEAEEHVKEAKALIIESQKEAGQIVKQAQITADVKAQTIERELEISIEKRRVQAHKDIEAERVKMLKEANEEIINTAIAASKEILKREINEEDNKQYLKNFIDHIDDEE